MGTEIRTIPVTAAEFLDRMVATLFGEPPAGHFWLEHLVRVLAQAGPGDDRIWRLFTVEHGATRIPHCTP